MKYRLIEKTYDSFSVTTPVNTASVDVGGIGGDSVCFQLVVTDASTPNTANITMQGSLDDTNWVTEVSAVNVTTDGTLSLSKDRPTFRYYRVAYAIASGSYTSSLKVLVKGDRDI